MSNQIIQKEWYGRGTHKYNPEIHIPLLHEIFGNCHGIAAFCAKAEIAVQTFMTWCKKYPEFNDAYHIALAKGAAKWEYLPFKYLEEGKYLDFRYWAAIGRGRYNRIYTRVNKAKGDTTLDRLRAVWQSLEDGAITSQEYNQIASGLATESKISEIEIQKQTLEHMKMSNDESKDLSDEKLKELMEAFVLIKSGKGKVVSVD